MTYYTSRKYYGRTRMYDNIVPRALRALGTIILLLLYMVCRVVFHKVLDLLTFPCWMEYEQKPFIFQDKVSALLIDNGKAAELGIWLSFFWNLWCFYIPCKPRNQTVTLSARLKWTSTFTNNWILHGCSLFKTRIANLSSWIFQSSPFLDSCFSILDPWVLILPYQNITTFRRRELSFKDRVKTVNLPLSRTVYRLSGKKEQLQLNVFRGSLLRWFLGVVYREEVVTEGGQFFLYTYTLLSPCCWQCPECTAMLSTAILLAKSDPLTPSKTI